MAWPPPLPPATRSNSTPQLNDHADDHNVTAAALADIVSEFQSALADLRVETGALTGVTLDTSGDFAVTFPEPFGSVPVVMVSVAQGAPRFIQPVTLDAAGFTARAFYVTTGDVATGSLSFVTYLAVGPRA